MSKETLLILLGSTTVIVPFLGVPSAWRIGFLVVVGLWVASLGFLIRRETLAREVVEDAHSPFVERVGSHAHFAQHSRHHSHEETADSHS